MTYTRTMVFVETSLFSSWIKTYLKDEELRQLQNYLLENPEAGKIIRSSGGIRKLRWARLGMGKSGGLRVIYYWAKPLDQIYLLTVYSKNEQENIDASTLKRIAKQLENMS